MTEPASLDVLGRLLPSLALIVGALLVVRRLAQRGGRQQVGRGVRVLTRTGLTRGAVLAVVAVGERRFLVGATDHGVSLLGELDGNDLDSGESVEGQPLTQQGFGLAPGDPVAALSSPSRATDRRAHTLDRPWMGLVDRLRALTVRTHLERPIRAPQR